MAISSLSRLNSAKRYASRQIGLLEISIALDGRDAKLTVERELTKSNLVPGKSANGSRVNPDRRRITLDRKSGQAVLNPPDSHVESCRYFSPTKLADCSNIRPIREN